MEQANQLRKKQKKNKLTNKHQHPRFHSKKRIKTEEIEKTKRKNKKIKVRLTK